MRITPALAINAEFKTLDRLNVPRIHRTTTIEDFKIIGDKNEKEQNRSEFEKFKKYYNNIEENLENGIGLYICGPIGVGKSMLMTLTLMRAINICSQWNDSFDEITETSKFEDIMLNYKHTAYFIQATTLGQYMFTQNLDDNEMKIRRMLKKFTVLAIDDITKMLETKIGNEISFVDDILRTRYYMKLTTMMTSQMPLNELPKKLSEPIHDLVRHRCIELTFIGPSQRNMS